MQSFNVTLEIFACCGSVLSLQKNMLEGEETRLYFIALQRRRVLRCTWGVLSGQVLPEGTGFPLQSSAAESSCREKALYKPICFIHQQ